jgi:pimeloyl-ACP methyl ester carboxylesterase
MALMPLPDGAHDRQAGAMTDTRPAIVLVHGALTDASIWHPVIAELQRRGHRVLAPALPMRSLAGDRAELRSALDTVAGPIVVAGHSWGGSVISDPAALTPAVQALVFVAAFVQDAGETAGELNYKFPGSQLAPETTVVRPVPGGQGLTLRPEHFATVYAADVEPATAAVMAAAQRAIDPAALSQSFDGPASWRRLPSWALVATEDRSIPTEAQRFMAARAGSAVTEIAAAHAVPVAHPRETADVITAAAGYAAG